MKYTDFILNDKYSSIDEITRFSSYKTFKQESVSTHSYWVTLFTSLLLKEMFKKDSMEVLKIKLHATNGAIFHDFVENFTGDISHDVKYNNFNGDDIRPLLSDYEKHVWENRFGDNDEKSKFVRECAMIEDSYLNDLSKKVIKVADWLACIKTEYTEIQMGNKYFDKVIELSFRKIMTSIDTLEFSYLQMCDRKGFESTDVFIRLRSELTQLNNKYLESNER